MSFLEDLKKRVEVNPKTIILPESNDDRILRAVDILLKNKLAKIILLGSKQLIQSRANNLGLDLSSVNIVDPEFDVFTQDYVNTYFNLRKHKGISLEDAKVALKDLTTFGVMMLNAGRADGLVAGATQATANTLRPALQIIRTKPGVKLASSYFVMETKEDKIYFFADCAFVKNPTYEELAYIALETANSAQSFNVVPKVAMLSFSTNGSGGYGPLVTKVKKATALAKSMRPDLIIDGELQLDAAIVSKVASLKAPNSSIGGEANILVFPDLNSGNIGYKLVQRFANAKAIGPIVQGLNKPVNDLSRGCSVDDIVDVVVLTSVEATK